MDSIEVFKNKLNQIINESNLPASILKLILENTIYQIELINMIAKKQKTEEKKES